MIDTKTLKLGDIVVCEFYKEKFDNDYIPILGIVLGYEIGYNGYSQNYVTIESVRTHNKHKIENTLLEMVKLETT